MSSLPGPIGRVYSLLPRPLRDRVRGIKRPFWMMFSAALHRAAGACAYSGPFRGMVLSEKCYPQTLLGTYESGLRFQPFAPFTVLLGEALFVLPWIWAPMLAVAFRPRPRERLLVWLAAPPIVAFALIAAWSSQRILFHWAAPGYLMLFPLLGRAVAERLHVPAVRRTLAATTALIASAVAIIGLQTSTDFAGSLTANLRKDPTIEGIDWTSIRTDLTARGLLPPGTVVGVPNWRDGGKIAYALGPDVTVVCLNPDSRQFGFATEAHAGDDMLLIGLTPVSGPFDRIEPLPPTSVRHRGRVMQTVSVSLGHRLIAWPPK